MKQNFVKGFDVLFVEINIMAETKNYDSKFLYVPIKGKIKIRFIGPQAQLFQYFRTAPMSINVGAFENSDGEKLQSSFFKEHNDGDKNYAIAKRIVSLVIDREDEKIKAFACPISVWHNITEMAKENDFEISKSGRGLNTRYFAQPLGISSVTEDQEKMVNATLESFTFSDIFVKNEWEVVDSVIERIENRWEILDL